MNIPKKWSDVNLKKYIALHDLYKNETDEIELTFKRLAIVLDISYEEVEAIPLVDYNRFKEDLEFLNTEPNQTKFKDKISLNGVEYSFIEVNKIKLGEFVDLEFYQKDFLVNIHRILSILYQNNGQRANEEEILLNLDVETGLSAFFFIYLYALNLLPSDMEGYSQMDKAVKEMKKLKRQIKKRKALQK